MLGQILLLAVTCLDPLDLVVPQRADIMAKYLYAQHRAWGVECPFSKQLYYRHLEVWNGFWEEDPPKRGFEDYETAFNTLLDSIELEGFNPLFPIPLFENSVITNGGHRLTSCLLHKKKVLVESCPYGCNYGFDFFKSKGLETKYLDAMALQYCELKPNSSLIVIFPSAVGQEEAVESLIKKYASIIYQKEIPLTKNGGVNLIVTLYDQEAWMGTVENNYEGARFKASCCFPAESTLPLRAYLVESTGLSQMQKCKESVRSLFRNHHTIHTTDTHEQAIMVARTLFNQNSIHCLNSRKDLYFPLFEQYLTEYRKQLAGREAAWFCVDGGAVLAAYGLRECHDFDVLHFEETLPIDSANVESHNSYLCYHALPLHDILFDPDHYFFYRGVKFCALPLIKEMKMNRSELKDRQDIALIDQVLESALCY